MFLLLKVGIYSYQHGLKGRLAGKERKVQKQQFGNANEDKRLKDIFKWKETKKNGIRRKERGVERLRQRLETSTRRFKLGGDETSEWPQANQQD